MVACLALMVVFLQVTQTIATLRTVQDDLALATADIVWVPSIYTLFVASGVLLAGSVADRYGRKKVFLVGVAGMTAGSVWLCVSGSLTTVLTAQAITGVGAAMVLSASLALVTHAHPEPRARAVAISLWAASSGVGLALGPVNAGLLTEVTSWNAAFGLNVVVGGIALLAGARLLPESSVKGARVDGWGGLLGTVGMAAFVYAAIEAGRNGFDDRWVMAAAALAGVCAVAFVVVELRVASPMVHLRLLRHRSYSGALLVASGVLFAFVGITLLQLLWLQEVKRLSVLESAVELQASFAGFIGGSVVAGVLVRRVALKFLALAGVLVAAVGAAAFVGVDVDSGFGTYGPLLFVFGLGCGFANAPSTALAVSALSAGWDGVAAGTVNAARQVGAVLGTSVLGPLMTSNFTDALPSELVDSGLPRATAVAVTNAVSSGSETSSLSSMSSPDISAAVMQAVARAFTDATTEVVGVAGVVLAALFVVSGVVLRR